MTATPNIIADFTTQLSVAIAVGGTTGTLYSNTDDDGTTLPTGLYYFTIDGANSAKEHISCTNTAGALTNIKTVSRQGVETAGAARAHRVGASVTMTDFATYKAYIDSISLAGTTNATQSVQGLLQVATAAQINSGTTTGSTGAILGISPDQLAASNYGLNIPTAAEKANLSALTSLTGMVAPYAGRTAPTGWLLCDGSAVSRTTYAALLAVVAPSATVTITNATPGVFTATAHGLVAGDKIHLTTTGGLPTGLATNTDYFVISGGLTANAFEVSATRGGAAINTSSAGSGVHTFYASNYGKGDGSTTFNVPDMRGFTPFGKKTGDANFDILNVPNTYVGEKTHVITVAEMPAHNHPGSTVSSGSGASGSSASFGNQSLGTAAVNVTSQGSDTAHNTLPPYVIVHFIIKT